MGDLNATATYSNENYPATVTQQEHLTGWWEFDNPTNLGEDSSENLSHLNDNGNPTFHATGKWDGAIYLDGNDMLEQGAVFPSNVPTGGTAYSISCWINPDQGGNRGIVGWGTYGSASRVNALRMNGNNDIYNYWWGNDLNAGSGGDLRTGTSPDGWHHILATYDPALGSNRQKIYIDGLIKAQRNASGLNAGAGSFTIGRTGTNEYFQGLLDDLRIYATALTTSDLAQIYAGDIVKAIPSINFAVTALKGPQSYSAIDLPDALTINPTSGLISGTTMAIGEHNVTIQASNLSGASAPQTLVLTVRPNIPILLDLNASTVGATYAMVDFSILDTGGENPALTLFHGTTDGNQTSGDWTANVPLGTLGSGSHSASLTGLTNNTQYFLRARAVNSAGTVWTVDHNFTTSALVGPPIIATLPSTSITTTSSTISGNLFSYDGGDQPNVTLYYGDEDNGTNDSAWDNSVVIGSKGIGTFTHNLTGFTPGTRYFYRFKAVNSGGTAHSAGAGEFVTIGTPAIEDKPATNLTETSGTLNARITSLGGVTYFIGAPFNNASLPGLIMWMDGNDPNGDGTSDTNTSNITVWNDKSADARHFAWTRGDPQFEANVLNGMGVVDFDGNDGIGQNDKTMYNDTANGFSMFAVSRYDGTDSERVISSIENWNWYFAGHGQYHTRIAHFNGWGYLGTGTEQDNNDWHIYEVTHTNTDRGNYWLDAVKVGTDTTGSGDGDNWRPKRIRFGGYQEGGSEESQCQIAEFLTFNRVLSEEERLKVEGYLGQKWGLHATMFANNHPYVSVDPFHPLITQGGEQASVTFYWGDDNGSANGNVWDNNHGVAGTHDLGLIKHDLTGLTKGATYYYSAKVSNSGGDAWAQTRTFAPANRLLGKDTISGLVLWLDASDLNGDYSIDDLANGSAIASWTDKSNQANQALQTIAANRPTYKKSVFGEKPGINFDGTGDFLYLVDSLRLTAGPISAFVMSKRDVQGGDSAAYLLGENSWNLTAGPGNSPYSPEIKKFFASSGKTITNLKIGKDGTSSSFDFAGDIAEVLIFARELTSEETEKVEGYLAHRWGGTDSLPLSHTYRDLPPSFDNSPKITMKPYVSPVGVVPIPLNPAIISSMNVWFDANDSSTTNTNWSDKSGNGHTATRTAGTLTLVDNALNGMPVVNFADNTYANVTGSIHSKQQYIVFNLPNVGDWGSVLGSQQQSGYMLNRNGYMWNNNYPAAVRQNGGPELSGNFQLSNIGNYMVVRITGNNNNTAVRSGWALGRQQGWGRLPMNLAEVVSFDTILSAAEEDELTGYLAHKWGLVGDLPASHPYKYVRFKSSKRHELYIGTPVNLQVETTKGLESYSAGSTLGQYGLSIDSNTGVISGTPSKMGDFNCTITAMNSSGSDTKSFFFRVLKGTKSINWNQSLVGLTYGDAPVELNASATIGGVSYSSSDETIVAFGGQEVRNPILENGLVRYWTFDEANGSTFSDVRGSFDGTLAGGAVFVPGKFGNAVKFDGSTAEVDFGLGAGDLGDKFTASVWVKWTGADSPANAMRILENKNDSNSTDGWAIFTESNNDTNVLVRGSSNAAISPNVTPSWKANNWHHIVAVFNSANIEVFADGISRSSGVIAPVKPGGKSLKMGKWHNGNANTFEGLMDDLRLYDKVLTANEVVALFGGGSGDFARSSTGTAATIKNSGTVTVTAHASGTKSMYSANTVSKTVTIGKAPLTLTADDKTRNVGLANPPLTHFLSGFVNDDNETTGLTSTISLITDADASSPEGTYAIVPTATADKYFITYLNGSLIVSNKTSQSISLDPRLL